MCDIQGSGEGWNRETANENGQAENESVAAEVRNSGSQSSPSNSIERADQYLRSLARGVSNLSLDVYRVLVDGFGLDAQVAVSLMNAHRQSNEDNAVTAEIDESTGISQANLLAKLKLQDFRCALTGRALTPDIATLDHIKPKSVSRDDSISNVHWVHEDVNRAKGTMELSEFVGLCRDVVSHVGRSKEA